MPMGESVAVLRRRDTGRGTGHVYAHGQKAVEARLRARARAGARTATRAVLADLAVLAVLAASGASKASAQAPLEQIDAYIPGAMAAFQVPGLAIAIVKDDSVVFAKGYGVREVGKPEKVDERTLFAIGSSSKAFTVALLGQLVDEGKVKWDDPVTKYLPGFQLSDPYRTREMMVRDLVTHRVDVARADGLWYGTPYSRDEIVRRARFLPPIASFRSAYNYNNIMFLTAGQLAAAVAGKSWDDLVTERVFRPLGMSATNTSTDSLKRQTDVASPHAIKDGRAVAIPWRNIDNVAPAGSINSNVLDMARWVRFQLGKGTFEGKEILKPATLAEMHAPQTIVPLRPWLSSVPDPINALMVPGTHFMMYGMGWFLQDYRGRKLVNHGGAIDGMRAQVAFVPEERLGVVILTNLNGDHNNLAEAMIFRVLDAYFGGARRDWAADLAAGVRKNLAAAEAAQKKAAPASDVGPSLPLEKYAGVYTDSLMGDVKVTLEDGKLVARTPGFTLDLAHRAYETFRGTARGGTGDTLDLTFAVDASGKPSRLTVPNLGEFRRAPDAPKTAAN
ncbi:MAG TPA: serine hydrolase [Longimicrobiales bacterium]|nr:serine hydrolase [Longimicrobiales bacterium]